MKVKQQIQGDERDDKWMTVTNLQLMFLRVHATMARFLLKLHPGCSWLAWGPGVSSSLSGKEQRGVCIRVSVSLSMQDRDKVWEREIEWKRERRYKWGHFIAPLMGCFDDWTVSLISHLQIQSLSALQISAWLSQHEWQLSRPVAVQWRGQGAEGSHIASANPGEMGESCIERHNLGLLHVLKQLVAD